MKPVIEIKNLSKKYLISSLGQGNTTLVDKLSSTCRQFVNRLSGKSIALKTKQEEFWALKNLSCTIEEGDRVGIIGRNGAGKSTLLKLISRITDPTEGQIKVRGRVASLLEVGTGFHPELTGRENIYLNGAILGLRSKEITKRFDEIVDFAEIEKFLDTPVKRYSSGMFARLGFAVAAHLDPDLLIVDEVLAVGDQQFQSKCLKKLNQLGEVGRTVLFVSHDIGNILSLCNKGLWLQGGEGKYFGPVEKCLSHYMKDLKTSPMSWEGSFGDEHIVFKKFALKGSEDKQYFTPSDSAFLELEYEVLNTDPDLLIGFSILNQRNQIVARAHTADDILRMQSFTTVGFHKVSYPVPSYLFNEGEYIIRLECVVHNKKAILNDDITLRFPVYIPKKNTRYQHLQERGGIFLGNHFSQAL